MQWDKSHEAGFTTGTPWIKVNPNYTFINAKDELADEYSVFYFYQKLIGLRRKSDWSEVIVYGDYELLDKDDENVFSFTRSYGDRKLLVICNLSDRIIDYTLPFDVKEKACLISNYESSELSDEMFLRQWFAGVWEIE